MKSWKELLQQEEPRLELKSRINPVFSDNVYAQLESSPMLFQKEFPNRRVNSIYFDDLSLTSFGDNLGGIGARIKARLRWYGDSLSVIKSPVLEFKIKKNSYGWKNSFHLDSDIHLSGRRWQSIVDEVEQVSPEDSFASLIQFFPNPTAMITYTREYYRSSNKKARITLDTDVRYYDQYLYSDVNTSMYVEDPALIFEIKVAKEDQDLLSELTNNFNIRVTKNSKYVNAMMNGIHI